GGPAPTPIAFLCDICHDAEDVVDIVPELVPHLLPASLNPRHPPPAILGVQRLGPADLADALSDTDRPPKWWANLYTALSGADTTDLGALPVPLADGRLVRGPRSLLVPEEIGRAHV